MIVTSIKTNIKTFCSEVIDEAKKVVWPIHNETLKSTLVVLVVIALSSLFFLTVDMVVYRIVNFVIFIGK